MQGKKEEKIRKLKEEWASEVSKISEDDEFSEFNQKEKNKEYETIKNKYLPRILELMGSSEV